jgi:hypothetical protein
MRTGIALLLIGLLLAGLAGCVNIQGPEKIEANVSAPDAPSENQSWADWGRNVGRGYKDAYAPGE